MWEAPLPHLGRGSGGSGGGLLVALAKSKASRGLAVAAIDTGANANHAGVDTARDAVVVLYVRLWDNILCTAGPNGTGGQYHLGENGRVRRAALAAEVQEHAPAPAGKPHPDQKELTLVDGGLGEITETGSLNHIANGEALDGLVLGDAAAAVQAADADNVAASLLSASMVTALNSLKV